MTFWFLKLDFDFRFWVGMMAMVMFHLLYYIFTLSSCLESLKLMIWDCMIALTHNLGMVGIQLKHSDCHDNR